jgi:uncharacterized membrane-anchored protein YjiN (DUF445 family)
MASPETKRNPVGAISLAVAVTGAVACQVALASGVVGDARWVRLMAAGFEAALVGGLADWFAVTALFRHPLGIPIPHTAIIPMRRAKLIEGIVAMVEDEWLSPAVIGARLERFAPSAAVVDWLQDPAHLARLSGPVRDALRAVAATLTEGEVAAFIERGLGARLSQLRVDAAAGRWLRQAIESPSAGAAAESLSESLANLAGRPETARELDWWLGRSADTLHDEGRRVVPFFLRRKAVRRRLVDAACGYATAELHAASRDPGHPLRVRLVDTVRRFAARLEAGDPAAVGQVERLRNALAESLETGAVVRAGLTHLREQLERDLADPASALATLVDRKLESALLDVMQDPARRARFDDWVRATATSLLERHHHQIGLTVREHLEALETETLVARIEGRVGGDLQFIRLNGAVVGGLIGLGLALLHWTLG